MNQKNVEVNWGVSFRDYTEKDLQSNLVVKSFSSSNLKVSVVLLLVFVWYQPPPPALRFSLGRGERETSDWG